MTPAVPGLRLRSSTVEAQVAAGGEASVSPRGPAIPFDGSAGQGEALPGPADLLTAAFAACAMQHVERFSHLLPFASEQASLLDQYL